MTMPGAEAPRCSRAGCGRPAAWSLNWRNPKIHREDRVKRWLACDDHKAYLSDYLSTRGFPLEVVPFHEPERQAD